MPSGAARLVLQFAGTVEAGASATEPVTDHRDSHNLDSNQLACLRRSARVRGLPVGATLAYTRTLRPVRSKNSNRAIRKDLQEKRKVARGVEP